MTKKEQLEELKERLFLLEMKDRWDAEDRKYYDELIEKINKLKEVLNFDLDVKANIDARNIVAIDVNGNRWHIGGVRK